ncbi:hypothetical protein [Caviibacterium pharyngocola]|uniref:Uncharacterized protein n=1 Tax=Caviibacterium pharyngocola TaxID=28159 RepID=A0A2M8RTB8_9PAST|nr:hypothetical protein [Caviibacterium pharyngocola]PJG82146.1 hypothetical protein CVP04_10850 [Caviibacterium pharyngocola]
MCNEKSLDEARLKEVTDVGDWASFKAYQAQDVADLRGERAYMPWAVDINQQAEVRCGMENFWLLADTANRVQQLLGNGDFQDSKQNVCAENSPLHAPNKGLDLTRIDKAEQWLALYRVVDRNYQQDPKQCFEAVQSMDRLNVSFAQLQADFLAVLDFLSVDSGRDCQTVQFLYSSVYRPLLVKLNCNLIHSLLMQTSLLVKGDMKFAQYQEMKKSFKKQIEDWVN